MSFAVEILAVGKMKPASPFHDAFHEYLKRIKGDVKITEIEARDQAEELKKIIAKLDTSTALIVLDEKGQSLSSKDFAQKVDDLLQIKGSKFQCVIGGADGLNDDIRQKADILLGFGKQTWPHMMVRVMLAEQLYRAQQILANHPYHRE